MSKAVWIAVAAACIIGLADARAQEKQGWVKISHNLTESVEGYDDSVPGARGIGGLVVDRHTGDVLMGLNGPPFGLYRSGDAGRTWERIDGGNVVGGWVRSHSIQLDQDKPGRIAAFRVGPPAPEDGPKSAVTLDGGQSWRPIADAWAFHGLSGWVYGMVDWSREPLHVMAQNRVRPDLQLSTDGGQNFKKLPGKIEGIVELTWNHQYMRARQTKGWEWFKEQHVHGFGACEGAVLLGRYDGGIDRSTDGGESYERVSDFTVSAPTPIRFDGRLYWGAEKGVIVSEDAGKTWALSGSELPMVRKGPFFGADAADMVVVAESGVYRTSDAGRTWNKVCDLFKPERAWRADRGPAWLRTDYAWDHTRNIVYVAGMAGPAYKLEVE